MTVFRIAAAVAMASLALPVAAQGNQDAVGRVAAASDGAFVARGGKMIPATAGMALVRGDRVVTRANATAKVSLKGCEVAVKPMSLASVNAGCAAPTTMASTTGLTGSNAADEETVVVGVLAAAAVIGGVIVALNADGTPASP